MGDFRGTESGHWYASPATVGMGLAKYEGEPVTEVPSSDGRRMVEPDGRHAVKYHLAPGTTSVTKMLHKQSLMDWGCRVTAEAGWEIQGRPNYHEYDHDRFMKECLERKEEIASKAANEGSVIHAGLEKGFLNQIIDEPAQQYFQTCKRALEATFGDAVQWVPEKPFYFPYDLEDGTPVGVGGRTDLLGMRAKDDAMIVVDFKTRDFTAEQLLEAELKRSKGQKTWGRLTPYETEPLQIASNCAGHAYKYERAGRIIKEVHGANLYLSRLDPNISFMHVYTTEDLEKACRVFRALHTVFVITKGIPGR